MSILKEYRFVIGIDPGKHTGLAHWDTRGQTFVGIDTLLIHQAFKEMQRILTDDTFVRLEDARQVRYKTKAERAQGAGSVKRDVEIWIDFFTDYHIAYELVRPQKKMTKWPSAVFASMTGWKKPTSQHGRDAAMLVYGWRNLRPVGAREKI